MNATIMLVVAAPACLITFLIARRTLRDLKFGPPGLLAALVAGLAFLGLMGSGNGMVAVILIPYAALAIALLVLFLLFFIARLARSGSNRDGVQNAGVGQDMNRIHMHQPTTPTASVSQFGGLRHEPVGPIPDLGRPRLCPVGFSKDILKISHGMTEWDSGPTPLPGRTANGPAK